MPAPISRSDRPRTARTSRGAAPTARQIPSSRVRSTTASLVTPCTPTTAITSASPDSAASGGRAEARLAGRRRHQVVHRPHHVERHARVCRRDCRAHRRGDGRRLDRGAHHEPRRTLDVWRLRNGHVISPASARRPGLRAGRHRRRRQSSAGVGRQSAAAGPRDPDRERTCAPSPR